MSEFKKFILIGLTVFAVVILIYGLAFFSNQITGRVSLELESVYEEGEPLDGTLKLSLREGEFIPASSKIVFENSGQIYEYSLSEFISESPVEGDFYVEGKFVSGTGEGYGIQGDKADFPKVYFTLDVFSKASSEKSKGSGSGQETENTSEETDEIVEEESETETQEDSETSEETSEQILEESITETQEQETSLPEQASEQAVEAVGKTKKEKPEKEEKSKKEKSPKDEETVSEPTITGNIISNIFGGAFNLFLRLTGQVSLEFENQINGEVSSDNEFVYELKGGEKVEILSGSVRTDSKELSDGKINVDVKGKQVTVTTDYLESEYGFGKEYLGDNAKKTLSMDLSKLDFVTDPGELKISLVYSDEEILSLTTSLVEGEISAENETEISEDEEEEKVTLNKTKVNLTIGEVASVLTETERETLVNEFGNASVEITKAEKTSQGIFVRFGIKDFWVEHHYDSEISNEELNEQVEQDRIGFLKDLARKFSKQEIQKQEVEGLIGSYAI